MDIVWHPAPLYNATLDPYSSGYACPFSSFRIAFLLSTIAGTPRFRYYSSEAPNLRLNGHNHWPRQNKHQNQSTETGT